MRIRRIQILMLLSVVLLTYGVARPARPAAALQEAKVVADSGFTPATHGFGFRNYGNEPTIINLTPVEMRRLFGDGVCAGAPNAEGGCDLTPPAAEWMEKVSKSMNGGHCDGMATLASVFYYNIQKETPEPFGTSIATDLTFESNAKLQREIAYWFTTQFTAPGNSKDLKGAPSKVVETLIKSMTDKSETYTIGIYQPDGKGGHSITPYAVKQVSDSVYKIMVYDNNFPKEEKFIEVDMVKETWVYFTASNPAEEGAKYEGNADTKTLTLTPDSARLGKQDCPVCAAAAARAGLGLAAQTFNEIWLVGDGKANSKMDLLITDDQGHKLGMADGKLVNEIPGARVVFARSGPDTLKDDQEPIYYIPTGIKFSVVLDASKATREENASVSLIGPGHDISIDNIKVGAGQKDLIDFSPDGTEVTYTPSGSEAPDISVGVATSGADYAFTVYGFDLDQGAAVDVALDLANAKLKVMTKNAKNPATYGLYVNRVDDKINQEFYHDGIELAPGATALINFGKWDGKGDLTVEIDATSDGTVDSTLTETNQPKPATK